MAGVTWKAVNDIAAIIRRSNGPAMEGAIGVVRGFNRLLIHHGVRHSNATGIRANRLASAIEGCRSRTLGHPAPKLRTHAKQTVRR